MDTLTELTPAEAMALLDPQGSEGRAMFKATVMALMLQGHVRAATEARGLLGTPATRLHLRPGLLDVPGLPGHVRAVAVLLQAPAGRLVSAVATDARLTYSPHLERFKGDLIVPALIGHELLERQARKVMGLPLGSRLVATPAGVAVQVRLRALLDRARGVPAFWDSDPAQAAAIVAALGTLVLLVDELAPHLQRLSDALRVPPPGDAGSVGGSSGDASGSGWDHDHRGRSSQDGTGPGQSNPEFDGPGRDGAGLGEVDRDTPGSLNLDGGAMDFGGFDAGFDAAAGSGTRDSGGWGDGSGSSGGDSSSDNGSDSGSSGGSDSGGSSDTGGGGSE